ncbi:uncharacterized protein LOC129267048 isoform X2 [Lytechinus pictus]|uniref:uncharacterized protein LOC129267048 isoform X2 n=1 Tax=Lytechinus pictus TaxID=7653 RepID=UPI0030B9F2F5
MADRHHRETVIPVVKSKGTPPSVICVVVVIVFLVIGGLVGIAIHIFTSVQGPSTVIFEPVRDHGVEAALVVIPGAEIRGEAYLSLTDRIQRQSPLRLWVALTTDYLENRPFFPEISLKINNSIVDLVRSGMPANTPMFFAGHSLGGVFLQSYVNSNPSAAQGLMLWGSYLTGASADLAAFPTPIMHLSGDLDGQVRITRIEKPFRELETLLTEDPAALATKPVIIMEGVNHFQFASGEVPPEVVERDISSELTATEAWSLLAEVISDFMSYNMDLNKGTAFENLEARHFETKLKMAPLSTFKDIEWNGEASPWITDAQELVAAFPKNLTTSVTIYNIGYTDQRPFENSTPSVVLDAEGVVNITTTSNVEFPFNPVDISAFMNSANEIAGKMINQEAIMRIVKGDGYGDSATCRVINEEAYRSAYNALPEIVRSRYDSKGNKMIFSDDVNATNFYEWVYSNYVTYETQGNGSLEVTSTSLYTDEDFPMVNLAGMYYCKLMSPYRAMEWMYVDSLRPNMT